MFEENADPEAIAEYLRDLELMVDAADDVVYLKSLDGRYLYMNPAGANLLGRKVADVVGASDTELFGPEAAAEIRAIDHEIATRETRRTYVAVRRLGERDHVFYTSKVAQRRNGQWLIAGISRDMTAKGLQRFDPKAASIAHQINNPLAYAMDSISGILDRLSKLEGVDPAVVADLSEQALTALHGVSRIRNVVAEHLLDPWRQPGRPPTPPPVEPDPRPRLRVLVVDDEPMVLKAVQRRLRRYHEVTCATGGKSAIELLASGKHHFDAVISDVMMPDVSGVDLYKWIQRYEPHLAVRVVFMTGGAYSKRTRKFLESVTQPVVPKPFARGDLLSALDALDAPEPPDPSETN